MVSKGIANRKQGMGKAQYILPWPKVTPMTSAPIPLAKTSHMVPPSNKEGQVRQELTQWEESTSLFGSLSLPHGEGRKGRGR